MGFSFDKTANDRILVERLIFSHCSHTSAYNTIPAELKKISQSRFSDLTLSDGGRYHIETSLLI